MTNGADALGFVFVAAVLCSDGAGVIGGCGTSTLGTAGAEMNECLQAPSSVKFRYEILRMNA